MLCNQLLSIVLEKLLILWWCVVYKRGRHIGWTLSVEIQPFNMEHSTFHFGEKQPTRSLADPRHQYTALKHLETYYWSCIDSYWSTMANPEESRLAPIIDLQIKLNRRLFSLHNELKTQASKSAIEETMASVMKQVSSGGGGGGVDERSSAASPNDSGSVAGDNDGSGGCSESVL
jgi:hypothetical protein